jgi:3',5'-cyclic AMP phosphodiesterase CpdA
VSQVRLVIVSDTHLSARAPEAEQNWSRVVAHVAGVRPDLVIHAGDLTLDGMTRPEDLQHARTRLDQLGVPWVAVPGNHDIGDNPSRVTPAGATVSSARRQRWTEVIGDDWWARHMSGWSIVGVNAQLFESGLPAEEAQWAWLDAQLGNEQAPPRTVLIIHKPIDASQEELRTAPPSRFVPPRAGGRITRLLNAHASPIVLSGHVHQYRRLQIQGTAHAWAPTTWAVLPDTVQPRLGVKRCGVLSVELDSRGATVSLVEPDGLQQLTLGRDLADPYSH